MKNRAEYIDEYLMEIKDMVKNAIKLPTKEDVIFEIAEKLNFHLKKISDIAHRVNEDERDNIKKILGDDVFICTRVWGAWNVGTMTQQDFSLASEDEKLIDELYNALD